jgi:DNA-binding transcriptional LysR family regulator
MDWDKLRIFHTVAEANNFTHAGQALNLSQSAISRQMSSLEESLGVVLFTRHARGLVLTAEGEMLFKTTRSIFAQISTTATQLLEHNDSTRGVLKVAATVAMGSVWLAPRLPRLFKNHPDMALQLMLTDEAIDFTMREADVAIQFSKNEVDQNLCCDPLFSFRLRVYGSVDYFETYGFPEKPEDLDKHKIIVFGNHAASPVLDVNWLLRLGSKPGVVRDPFLVINNAYGILQSVKNGLGVATLSDYIARDHPDLVPIFPSLECPKVSVYMVYPQQLAQSKKIAILKTFLMKELQFTHV